MTSLKFLMYNVCGLHTTIKKHNILREIKQKPVKAVAIGFARGVRLTLEERMVDHKGRYLFLRGRLCDMDCTLANIYCPNKNPIKYLKAVMEKLMEFEKGGIGDWKCTIKKKLHQNQLMDVWRIQHSKI